TRVDDASRNDWSEAWNVYANEHTWTVLDALFAVADETGKTPAQVALNWLLRQPIVTAPILGARTLRHLEDNMGATGWTLAPEQVATLNNASALASVYPYDVLARSKAERQQA